MTAKRGMPYITAKGKGAHYVATQAEKEHVRKKGGDWKTYEARVNGHVGKIKRKTPKRSPPDLYDEVYKDWSPAKKRQLKAAQAADGKRAAKRLDH